MNSNYSTHSHFFSSSLNSIRRFITSALSHVYRSISVIFESTLPLSEERHHLFNLFISEVNLSTCESFGKSPAYRRLIQFLDDEYLKLSNEQRKLWINNDLSRAEFLLSDSNLFRTDLKTSDVFTSINAEWCILNKSTFDIKNPIKTIKEVKYKEKYYDSMELDNLIIKTKKKFCMI
jgi:hypothetical protein